VGTEGGTGPVYRVTLTGGSRIAAQAISSTENDLLIEPRRQPPLKVPLKQVKSVRFRASAPTTDPQWLGIVEREQRGDALVIRRDADRLDPQQGLITGFKPESVTFDLEGTVVNAPIERLEGVVFGNTDSETAVAPIQVTDTFGSVWSVVALEASNADEPLRLQLSGSIRHELPLDQIASIRWSGGLRMLASEPPAAANYQPFLGTSVSSESQTAFFGPAAEGDFDLRMHSGSIVEYRIEPGYRTLAGAVRRHSAVEKASAVSMRIELDGKPVWEQSLQDAELRGFELPLQDARRLTIVVDNGGDGELGDTVLIVRPRLLK
jgi:hypothetical protein